MPPINKYQCNVCKFDMPMGWGGIAYVEGYDGKRVILTHPIENSVRERVLNIPEGTLSSFLYYKPKWWWSKKRLNSYNKNKELHDLAYERSGFLSDCVCIDCMQKQQLDLDKAERKCCSCSSVNVKSLKDLLGNVCPQCKRGVITEIETGIWT